MLQRKWFKRGTRRQDIEQEKDVTDALDDAIKQRCPTGKWRVWLSKDPDYIASWHSSGVYGIDRATKMLDLIVGSSGTYYEIYLLEDGTNGLAFHCAVPGEQWRLLFPTV